MERGYSSDLAAELASTLEWWEAAGADSLVAEEPRDWLKAAPAPPQSVIPAKAGTSGPASALPSPDAGFRRDDGKAPDPLPDQLPLLLDWFKTSPSLPYASPSAPRVCPSGDPAAGLMILAAMPSGEDCASGTLVSGAAGRLFDRMLAAIGRSRDTAYIAGLSCLRPAGGRLDPAGAARCAEIARHHIGLAAPKAVLLLGDSCSRALLGLGAAEARGRVHRVEAGGRGFDALVTLHPDFLLSQPAAKALAWADLQLLMEALS